jgi:hypothetical protein
LEIFAVGGGGGGGGTRVKEDGRGCLREEEDAGAARVRTKKKGSCDRSRDRVALQECN